jgi:integrase
MGVRIRQRSGVFWVFVNYKGQRKAKRVGDRKAAELVATRLRAKLAEGDTSLIEPPKAATTFAQYAEAWLEHTVKPTCKPNTLRFYRMNLDEHILPMLGTRPIASIARADCRSVLAGAVRRRQEPKKKEQPEEVDTPPRPLSVRSVQGIARTLSSVLTQAVDDGHLSANPAFRLGKFYRRQSVKAEIQPLTQPEVQQFLTAAETHAPREYALFLTALRTGLRLGELLGLQWGDIDFAGRFLEVRRQIVNGQVAVPKNGTSRRVDMSTQLSTALRTLLTERKAEKLRNGWKALPEWVFCTPEGGPLDGDNLRHRVFYRVLEKAKLRRIRIHDLRHTMASLLLQAGAPITYVSRQLGHADPAITLRVYAHYLPDAARKDVDRLDAATDAAIRNPRATEAETLADDVAVSG